MAKQNRFQPSSVITLAFSLCLVALIGCGDDVTNVTNVTNETAGIKKVSAYSDLPKCSEDKFGLMFFVADSAKVFYCDEEKWNTLNGEDGVDGKDGTDGKDGSDGKDGTDGKDGKNGTNGTNGKDGVSPVLFDSAGNYIPGKGDTISIEIINYGKKVEGLGECSNSRENEVLHLDSVSGPSYFICKSNSWQTATILEYDTYQWNDTTDGASKIGNVTKKLYVFDKDHWRASIGAETELGGCVDNRKGEVAKYFGVFFTCKNREWVPSTILEYDTYGKDCLTDGSIDSGRVHPYNKYVCDRGMFRAPKPLELAMNRGCTSYNKGESARYQYANYICDPDSTIMFSRKEIVDEDTVAIKVAVRDSSGWSYDLDHLNKGSIQDSRDGNVYKTIGFHGQIWMNENLRYEKAGSFCYHDSTEYCKEHGRFYNWESISNICPQGWHIPTRDDIDYFNKKLWVYDTYKNNFNTKNSPTYNYFGIDYPDETYTMSIYTLENGEKEHSWNYTCSGWGWVCSHPIIWIVDGEADNQGSSYYYQSDFIITSASDSGTKQNTYHNVRCIKDEFIAD